MKTTTPSLSFLLAVVLLFPVFSLRAWDRIIDFQDFDVGDYDGSEENPINETTVHITRDEGWEGTNTGGYAMQLIRADANDNRYYMMRTLGRGVSWGHSFSLVNFPTPITDIGTIYWEFMQVATSNDYIIGAAANPAVPVNPGDPFYTPWGWTGMTSWDQTRTGIQKTPENTWRVMDGTWRPATLEEPVVHSGCWYQVWQHLDLKANQYRTYIQGVQFPEPTVLKVSVDGMDLEDEADNTLFSENYLGWIHTEHFPWIYLWDLETWGYLGEGDWQSEATWIWVINADADR